MKLENMGKIWYRGGRYTQGFLLSMCSELKEIKEKKVVILGCGEEGFTATNLLRDLGIEIYCYADNSVKVQGTMLRGKKICSPYELFGEDVYFIAAVPRNGIASVRLQFMVHNIEDYSIYLMKNFHDLMDEDPILQESIIDAINVICFKGESVEDALPYMGICMGGHDPGRLGSLDYLISSEEKIYYEFIWAKDFLNHNRRASILEIGPGLGFMSLVFLQLFSDINIDWINFGSPDSNVRNGYAVWDKGLAKVVEQYPNRVDGVNGYIETNDFIIKKKYDMIILTEVFEHFALNPVNTMKKIKNALNPGGRVVFSTPDWGHVHIWKDWEEMPSSDEVSLEEYLRLTKCCHSYQYTKEELLDIFARVGLDVEKYGRTEPGIHNFMLS